MSSSLFAQKTKAPHINKKLKKQISKIEHGIKSGELTKMKQKKLEQENKEAMIINRKIFK